ncbi:MAG: GNAT family N-acetyltransferase [Balneolaceae bacterium]|nr:GNAT family N-acetyltransferase [Balneolaceae bacterium]
MDIRKTTKADLQLISEMNEGALPHVNSISIEEFEWFLKHARFFLTVEGDGIIAGFLIVLGPELKYDSLNYDYFSTHYDNFDYVDRIVIDKAYRSMGYGAALYRWLFEHSSAPLVCCEVNVKPRNQGSLAFHERMGFKEVGQHDTEGGKKRVSLQVKEL